MDSFGCFVAILLLSSFLSFFSFRVEGVSALVRDQSCVLGFGFFGVLRLGVWGSRPIGLSGFGFSVAGLSVSGFKGFRVSGFESLQGLGFPGLSGFEALGDRSFTAFGLWGRTG